MSANKNVTIRFFYDFFVYARNVKTNFMIIEVRVKYLDVNGNVPNV